MHRTLTILTSFLIFLLTSTGCKETVDPDPEDPIPIYDLTVNISPDNSAGTVTPPKGTYYPNEQLNLTATSAEGWRFINWTGEGISSTENPINIRINSDITITANFLQIAENFIIGIPVTDGEHFEKVTLISGGNGNPDAGLDQDDRESPPLAPPDAFFVGSVVDNMNLFTDSRPTANRIVWEIRLSREAGRSMALENWDISDQLEGNLMLVNDPDASNPSIEVDMQSESSYTVSDSSIQTLYVVYSAPEPAKMLAGEVEFGGIEITRDADDERFIDESNNRGLENISRD